MMRVICVGRSVLDDAHTDPLSVQRNVLLGLLLALAAGAWALLVWQSADIHMTMASSTMGMHALPFLAIWVIMMLAMMFPTAALMILAFHEVQAGKQKTGDAFVSTCVFVLAYISVWTLAGGAAYVGALQPRPLPRAQSYLRRLRPASAAWSSSRLVSTSLRL
jgi:predicted metal-binding membrane protein